MKILIIGAAGFVGANISLRIRESHHDLSLVDDLSFGYRDNLPKEAKLIEKDFNELDTEFVNKHDLMIFAACSNIIYAMTEPEKTMQNNAINTVALFKKFKGRIIYLSTASVYGQADSFPTHETAIPKLSNSYSTSKYIAEMYLHGRGNYTTLRLSNVYGPLQRPENPYCGVLGRFIDKATLNEQMIIYGTGKDTRDYTYVDDVIDAVMLAINKPALNTEINIATEIETSILELAHAVREAVDITKWKLKFTDARKIDTIHRRCLSNDRARKLLEWWPKTPLSEGIRETVKYFLHLSKRS